jgi:hypothetical protein
MLDAAVLVLNRSFLPIHVTSVRRAFILLYQGLAKAVDERYDTFEFDAWRCSPCSTAFPDATCASRARTSTHAIAIHVSIAAGGRHGQS